MKVLWFSVTHALYDDAPGVKHNGGGWISSLQNIVQNIPDIELGIAFEHHDMVFKKKSGSTTYYPINALKSPFAKFRKAISFSQEEKILIPKCLEVINDFKPDIIHVFGSEWCWALIQEYTTIPVVIHMQGSIPPYNNARVPGLGKFEILRAHRFNLLKVLRVWQDIRQGRKRALREEKILRMTRFYMGRTNWDKALSKLYAPNAKYYYCAEAMRPSFIQSPSTWTRPRQTLMRIVTTGNAATVKGMDVILKTAAILKGVAGLQFQWDIIGTRDISFYESFTGIKSSSVHVNLLGVLNSEDVANVLLRCHAYVQPSYIENSPNALCEAQLLGVPVVATFSGGIPSLISDNVNGILVPTNDPFLLADVLQELYKDPDKAMALGLEARRTALQRHDPSTIARDLMHAYEDISGVSI